MAQLTLTVEIDNMSNDDLDQSVDEKVATVLRRHFESTKPDWNIEVIEHERVTDDDDDEDDDNEAE